LGTRIKVIETEEETKEGLPAPLVLGKKGKSYLNKKISTKN
jgi:hypothetical protein